MLFLFNNYNIFNYLTNTLRIAHLEILYAVKQNLNAIFSGK